MKVKRLGRLVPALLLIFGVGTALLGLAGSTLMASATIFILGVANGYIAIAFFTWLQSHTPREMLGRMMSLVFFFNLGLVPLSQALAGALIKLSLTGLFVGAGALTLLLAAWACTRSEVQAMEL